MASRKVCHCFWLRYDYRCLMDSPPLAAAPARAPAAVGVRRSLTGAARKARDSSVTKRLGTAAS